MSNSVAEAFATKGVISRQLPGFSPRKVQIEMALKVEDAIQSDKTLLIEAGTGIGKTFAYLVPALLSEKRIVISTGTKHLQDQLYLRDLPLVRRALAAGGSIAQLKGRLNYLCLYRMHLLSESGTFESRTQSTELTHIIEWSGRSLRGDISEVTHVAESSPIWRRVTCGAESCLNKNCPYQEECFVLRARKEAQQADVLVINHHVFCADMVIRDDGFGELLPEAKAFILDEAHQLPEIASNFFGTRFTSRQFHELTQDIQLACATEAPDEQILLSACEKLESATQEMRDVLAKISNEAGGRQLWSEVAQHPDLIAATDWLQQHLTFLQDRLKQVAERGKALTNLSQRTIDLAKQFALVVTSQTSVVDAEPATEDDMQDSAATDAPPKPEESIHLFEVYSKGFGISITPLDMAPLLRQHMSRYNAAWVMTSATLTVNQNFHFFSYRLGLNPEKTETLHLESPFDFRRHAVLYHPAPMPDPRAANYHTALVDAVLPVLKITRGRAFLLFTSYAALHEVAELLAARLTEVGLDYPLFLQGDLPKMALLEAFRKQKHSILLGTSSFWEGVDVRGEALSCVVIAKLPFASPADPVEQARIQHLQDKGENAFFHYQIPHAVVALKQGVGRLIRDINDYGVLVLCDPRIVNKGYGKIFLDSLPPMTRTQKLERVERFFAWVDQGGDAAESTELRI